TWKTGMLMYPAQLNSTVIAVKTDFQPIQSQTVLQDDTQLRFTGLPGASTWAVDSMLFFQTAAAADLKIGWSGPSGATFNWTPVAHGNTSTTSPDPIVLAWIGSISDTAVVGGPPFGTMAPRGTLVVPAGSGGNFQFRWAQNVSTASQTAVAAGSWLRLMRIG
ncbi:hypothetical protein ACIBF5_26590, partial [Micromonospora sp. NPDC050417]|uniref:hypothetical protein n=1 Tax=Micromonospora sp. NPDC050417 TaxID=3364280 RepID=UPI003794C3C3